MKNDTPSSTADIVARNIALVAATKETVRFVAPDAAELNALFVEAFSPSGSRFLKRTPRQWFQKLFRLYASLTIRGLALHQALRKLHIEHAVREGLAHGFAQIVILGGGLDTLALRLHREFPAVNFLELDHPATQAVKRGTIEKYGLGGENLHLEAADFTDQTLAEILNACPHYNPEIKTIFICEGVLMYLGADEVDRLFNFIKTRTGAANRFIFTFMEPDKNGNTNFRNATFLVRLWLEWKNEPFKWGLKREELKDFLAGRGFSLNELATAETFRRIYLARFGLENYATAEGENVCICESVKSGCF